MCAPPELFALKKVAIAKHNAVLKAEKEAEIRRQQEEDLLLLNAMLDKERKAEEAELAYKAVLKKQAREYQAQLVELMKKEAVDEAASEAIRQAEQDKTWRKREEVWEKEKAARQRLMQDVMAVRREQVSQLTLVTSRHRLCEKVRRHWLCERVCREQLPTLPPRQRKREREREAVKREREVMGARREGGRRGEERCWT